MHINLTKLYQQPKHPASIENDRPRALTCYRSAASGSDGAMGFDKAIMTKFVAEGARFYFWILWIPAQKRPKVTPRKNITYLRGDMSSSGNYIFSIGVLFRLGIYLARFPQRPVP